MFTGIVEEIGKIKRIDKGTDSCSIAIEADKVLSGSNIGDSIAVNGVCLTVTGMAGNVFTADVMPETLRRSNLGSLSSGSYVNLERAMAANGRFGGHIVSGHIDGTGSIRELKREDNAVWVTVDCDSRLLKYIIEKGSITIDGISLTVAYVDDICFKVSIIPHTAGETTLLKHHKGDIVNLENDIIGKYVEKLLSFKTDDSQLQKQSGIDMNFLAENGFM
ncbi:MAG: riboflavin synthase [Coprococcus sp.]|nr:riboflavin synthase [Coprococcus sp.]